MKWLSKLYQEYAELSSNAVIDPKWLKVIHDTLSGSDGIEQTTGVQLRFLVGLPRNLDEDTIKARIEQIKRLTAEIYDTLKAFHLLESGNLGISFEEKTEMMLADQWLDEIGKCLANKAFIDKDAYLFLQKKAT